MVYGSKFFALVLFSILLAACAPAVHTDFDRGFDFSQLKNYVLLTEEQSNVDRTMLGGPLVSKRITESLNNIFQARGYSKSPSPDFYVSYQLETKTIQSRALGLGYGYGLGYFGDYYGRGLHGSNYYEEYEKAVLIILLYKDRSKSTLLWRGLSEKKLQKRSTNAKYIDSLIHQMVAEILKKFPPKNR